MDLKFRYINTKTGAFANNAQRYEGAFAKISTDVISVQPQSRRILFPHIGYPTEEGTYAIAINKGDGASDMGSFAWETFSSSSFGEAQEFTYIQQNTKYTSWYPVPSGEFLPVHGLLYDIDNVPGSYYLNGMLGDTDDTTLLQSTSGTIKQSEVLSYLHDTPVIMSDSNRIWITSIASPLETKGNIGASLLGKNNISMFSRSGLYTTVASVLNNDDTAHIIDGETYENAKAILYGYNNYTDMHKHIVSPASNTHLNKTFVSVRVLAGHIYTDTDQWQTDAFDTVVEEIDRLDNAHAEFIDGMWKPITVIAEGIELYYTGETMVDSNSIRIIGAVGDNSNYFNHLQSYNVDPKPSSTFKALTDNGNSVAIYDIENSKPPLIVFEPNGFYLSEEFEWGYVTRFTDNNDRWRYYDINSNNQRKIGIADASGIRGVCEDTPSQTLDGKKIYKIIDRDALLYSKWWIAHDNGGYNKGPYQCSIGIPIATSDYNIGVGDMTISDRSADIYNQRCDILDLANISRCDNTRNLVPFRGQENKYILAFVKISSEVDPSYMAKVTDSIENGGSGYSTEQWNSNIVSPGWGSYEFMLYFGRRYVSNQDYDMISRCNINTYHPSFATIHSYWTSTGSTSSGSYGVDNLNKAQSKYPPVGDSEWRSRIARINPCWPSDGYGVLDYAEDQNHQPTTQRLNGTENIQVYNCPTKDIWYTVYADLNSGVPNTVQVPDPWYRSEIIKMTPTTEQEESDFISKRTFDTKAFYSPSNPNVITFRITPPDMSSISPASCKVTKSKSEFISEGFTFDDVRKRYTAPEHSSYKIQVPAGETWRSPETGKAFFAGNMIDYVKYSGMTFEIVA